MPKSLARWIEHIEFVGSQIALLMRRLEHHGAQRVEPQAGRRPVNELPYWVEFNPDGVRVIFRLLMLDQQTDSDVVINNLNVFPPGERRQGHGSHALRQVLRWAAVADLNEVRVTQVVSDEMETFLRANGFEQCPAPNPCNDFVFDLSKIKPA